MVVLLSRVRFPYAGFFIFKEKGFFVKMLFYHARFGGNMKLSKEEIKMITTGYINVAETEKGLEFLRFSESQKVTFKNHHKGFDGDPFFDNYFADTCHTSAGMKFDFYTDAKKVSVGVSENKAPYGQNLMVFDVLINGKPTESFREVGDFTFKACGKRQKRVRVTVFFPNYDGPVISEVEIDGTYVEPAGTEPEILTVGDSITQGAGSDSFATWVNVMSQTLGMTVLNQASTGYVYDARTVERLCNPKIVICAYGINDHGRKTREELFTETDEYISATKKAYPDAMIAAVVPVWTVSEKNKKDRDFTEESRRILRKAYEKNNIYVIEGLKMVPHREEFFADTVHPSAKGHRIYGLRMAKEIKKILNLKENEK